jgi:hypothetical protein
MKNVASRKTFPTRKKKKLTFPYFNSKHNFFNNLNYRLNLLAPDAAQRASIVLFCLILMASSIEQTFLSAAAEKASCATHSLRALLRPQIFCLKS